MKKSLFIFTFFLIASMGQLFAQDSKRIGGQLIYGTNINTIGIGAIAEFPIADRMVISPSFSFYFPKNSGGVKTNSFELNSNLNYTFIDENDIVFYGIGGLNFTNYSVKFDLTGIPGGADYSVNSGYIGLNLGAGDNFDISKNFLPFGEIKYIIDNFG